jgi:hypothetical protein
MDVEQWAAKAEQSVKDYENAGKRFAEASRLEMQLTAEKPVQKADAILRVKSLPNPLNPDKPHSVSSAETLAETDPIYAAHLAKMSQAVFDKIGAETERGAARLKTELAIAMVRSEIGVS